MAKVIDNSYVGNTAGNPDLTSGLSRTNPQAHLPNNLVKLYGIRKYGGCAYAPTFTWAYVLADDELTITPTAGYNTTGLRYWKHRLVDEDGNEAFAAQASLGTNTAIVLDTSGLDPLKKWKLEFFAEVVTGDLHCGAEWWLELPAGFGLNATASGSGQDI